MHELDIGEVAQRSGLPPSTLRFYEDKGLIASIGRQGLRRQFHVEVLERLSLIALGRMAGFSLEEIGRVLGTDGGPHIDRKLLAAKAEEIEHSIEKLIALRDGLRHAAACPAPRHLECSSFRRLLRRATATTRASRRKATVGAG